MNMVIITSEFLKKDAARSRIIALIFVFSLCLVLIAGCSCELKTAKKTQPKKKPVLEILCPLCGAKVGKNSQIDRRVIAVKIGNDPASRPQSGLSSACVVYEEVTEGGITRFLALYLCRDCEIIGPVRSARPADVDIAFPYYPLFAHCGGARSTLEIIRRSGIADLDELAWTGAYWRSKSRRAPYNLYTDCARLRQAGASSYPFGGVNRLAFTFMDKKEQQNRLKMRERLTGAAESGSGQANKQGELAVVNNIYVPYKKPCDVRWSFNPADGSFLRFVAGVPQIDMNTGQQISASTVIIQYVSVRATSLKDVRGSMTPELGIVGSGRAQVFTCGLAIDANWEKPSRVDHTVFKDNAGKVIEIKPGSIWVEVIGAEYQASFD